jgi:hypothetical protein
MEDNRTQLQSSHTFAQMRGYSSPIDPLCIKPLHLGRLSQDVHNTSPKHSEGTLSA